MRAVQDSLCCPLMALGAPLGALGLGTTDGAISPIGQTLPRLAAERVTSVPLHGERLQACQRFRRWDIGQLDGPSIALREEQRTPHTGRLRSLPGPGLIRGPRPSAEYHDGYQHAEADP